MTDVVVCYVVAAYLEVATFINRLVVVVMLRIASDDIPCVEEARKVSKAAESDVDKRISAADTRFHPNCCERYV